jgi:hypothetical protein
LKSGWKILIAPRSSGHGNRSRRQVAGPAGTPEPEKKTRQQQIRQQGIVLNRGIGGGTMKHASKIGWLCLIAFVVLAGLGRQAAWAQANRGTITGSVTDTSGAVVAGAAVTVTNTGTNVPSRTVTNADGLYVVPNLFPGSYAVHFEKTGFESFDRTGITLNSTQVAEIDVQLKVGAATETVTVSGGAPVLDIDTASVGTNMKADVVNELPLSIYGGGRFVEDFAVAITPGYSLVSSPYGAVVNGGQWFTKDYTIDGTSGTSNIRGDSMDGGPSMEAVEEVQATTSGLDSQSSITGGGVMAFNLKSGTNQLHGSAFLYGHNELFDANTWTNDLEAIANPRSVPGIMVSRSAGPSTRTRPSSSAHSSASNQKIGV